MIAIDSTNLVLVKGLFNVKLRSYVDAATVSLRILDSALAEVIGATAFTADGDGDYSNTFDGTGLTDGDVYVIEVTIVDGVNKSKHHVVTKAGYLTSTPIVVSC